MSPNLARRCLLLRPSERLGTSHVSATNLIHSYFSDHITRLAALMTHALETGWAMYATWRGPTYQAVFQKLTAQPGSSCSLDLFSAYWRKRHVFEVRIN